MIEIDLMHWMLIFNFQKIKIDPEVQFSIFVKCLTSSDHPYVRIDVLSDHEPSQPSQNYQPPALPFNSVRSRSPIR